MAIQVEFSGNTFSLPTDAEDNWPDLTDYLVALSSAQSSSTMAYSVRIVAASTNNVIGSDTIVLVNRSSACDVDLPLGVNGRFLGVFDISGAALSNNITINCSSSETINGLATYTIQSNYGGIWFQFDGISNWVIVSERQIGFIGQTQYRRNEVNNTSIIETGMVAASSFPVVANGKACSFEIVGTNQYEISISLNTGEGMKIMGDYNTLLSAISDPSELFLLTDAGVGIYVVKSLTSNSITVKNRMGSNRNVEIQVKQGSLQNIAVWA